MISHRRLKNNTILLLLFNSKPVIPSAKSRLILKEISLVLAKLFLHICSLSQLVQYSLHIHIHIIDRYTRNRNIVQ